MRTRAVSILLCLFLVHVLRADEGKVGTVTGVIATWPTILSNYRYYCANDLTLCKHALQLNRAEYHIENIFPKICDASEKFPPFTCPYYLSMLTSHYDLLWNKYCKERMEKNDKNFLQACKKYVDMIVTQASPWLNEKILTPCIFSAKGSNCDRAMLELCRPDSYLCQRIRMEMKQDVFAALATSSEMCQNDGYPLKQYCDSLQKEVAETPKWMERYCDPYRSAYQLCYNEWPPACQIYKTVCRNGKRKECGPLHAQEAFCEEIATNDGTRDAYEKYCVESGTSSNQRYCNGVTEDLDARPDKFTRICTDSCKVKGKICDYCQKLLEQDPRKLWAECHDEELLNSAYCLRINDYCTAYSKSVGCGQVLREFVLWSLEFGKTKDTSEIVQRLAKFCERSPDDDCRTSVINVRDSNQGGNLQQIHSNLCAKYATACHNIITALKDDLDSISRGCDAGTWAQLSSCQIILDDCVSKKFACQLLLEQNKAADEINTFASTGPSEKQRLLLKYCAGEDLASPICQLFIEKAAEQYHIFPMVCHEVKLCIELLQRISHNDKAVTNLAKENCNPWKRNKHVICELLHNACSDKITSGCNALRRIQCETTSTISFQECLGNLQYYCDKSPREGDPLFIKCKNISSTLLKNTAAIEIIDKMCSSKKKHELSSCESIISTAEKMGQLFGRLKASCTDKKKMKTFLCTEILKRCEGSTSSDCLEVQRLAHNSNFNPSVCKTESNECSLSVKWNCVTHKEAQNKENCRKLFSVMNKEVAVGFYGFCVEKFDQPVLCDIAGEKLNSVGALNQAFLKHCGDFAAFSGKACKNLYNLCKKLHSDGSAGCDKLVAKYELQIALSEAKMADVNKTMEHLENVCGASTKGNGCKEYLSSKKTSDTLIIESLHFICSAKAKKSTCQRTLKTMVNEKSPIFDKLGLICDANAGHIPTCQELSHLCKLHSVLPICKKMIEMETRKGDLNLLNTSPSKSPEILQKYCVAESTEPEMCEVVKSSILARPDTMLSQLDNFCKTSAQYCHLFTQESILQNNSHIPYLYNKYCIENIVDEQCKIIQNYCSRSTLKECKETHSRVCVPVQMIQKCIAAIERECSYDQETRRRSQVQTCNELVRHAADSTSKIDELQIVCEGNGTACVGFVAGALDTNTGFSVFENWCPKKDRNLRQCKIFREECKLRVEEQNCKEINTLFAEFDPDTCNGKDQRACAKSLAENCDTSSATSEQKDKCNQLFEKMEAGDLIRLKNKCVLMGVQKTCDRIMASLRDLGAIKTLMNEWCPNDEDLQTHQCQEIKKMCLKYEADGCGYVMRRFNRSKRNWAIAGMIIGGIVILIGILFWILLGIERAKRDDDRERRQWDKREEKKRRKEEKKLKKDTKQMEKLAKKIMKQMKKKGKKGGISGSGSSTDTAASATSFGSFGP